MLMNALTAVSLIGLLVYPGALVAGVMALGSPGGPMKWVIGGVSILYPIPLCALLWWARTSHSLSLAALATIPTILLAWVLIFGDGWKRWKLAKSWYESSERHFLCNNSSFLTLEVNKSNSSLNRQKIYLVSKKFAFSYTLEEMGYLVDDLWVYPYATEGHPKHSWQVTILKSCKVPDGNLLTDTYELLTTTKEIQARYKAR